MVTPKDCFPISRIGVMRQPCAGDHRAWVAQNEIDKVAAGAPQFISGLGCHRTYRIIYYIKYGGFHKYGYPQIIYFPLKTIHFGVPIYIYHIYFYTYIFYKYA